MKALLLAALLLGCGPKVALPEVPVAPEVPGQGPDPAAVLAEGAGSLDPSTRGHALAWLVRTDPEPGAPSWAQRGLWDPEPWVERQVVEALARRGDANAVLVDFIRRDADPYVRATAGLRVRGDPATAEVFAAAWRAEPQAWRRAPLALVAAVTGDKEALATLSEALVRGEVGLELEFFEDLGGSGLTDLITPLREGTDRAEPELALPYVAARLRLGDADAATVLHQALSASDLDERLYALDIATALPPDLAWSIVKRAPTGDDTAGWYAAVARAAVEGDPTTILQAAGSPDREVRLQAARFVGEVAFPDRAQRERRTARDAVHVALADDDAEVRRTAIASLVKLGLEGDEAWLQALLLDDDLAVRVDAAGALRALGVSP